MMTSNAFTTRNGWAALIARTHLELAEFKQRYANRPPCRSHHGEPQPTTFTCEVCGIIQTTMRRQCGQPRRFCTKKCKAAAYCARVKARRLAAKGAVA